MELDLRWPIFFLSNLLLIALLRMVNDAASLYGMFFSVPALLVLLPALHTPPRWGILLCFASALVYASPYPGPMTPFLITFGLGYVIFRQFSSQLRRFQRMQLLTSITGVNTLLIVIQSMFLAPAIDTDGVYTQRILTDAVLSALLIYPVGTWFIDWQYSLMMLAGSNPRADAPPK